MISCICLIKNSQPCHAVELSLQACPDVSVMYSLYVCIFNNNILH